MISRRQFVLGMVVLCGGVPGRILAKSDNNSVQGIDSVKITTSIPRLLFFPQCKKQEIKRPQYCSNASPVVTHLQLQSSKVIVHFSHGQEIQFAADQSFNFSRKENSLREGILIKSLSAYVIATLYRTIRAKTISDYDKVKQDFNLLQQQSVLDAVTLRALYNLVGTATKLQKIKGVAWNPEKQQFNVL